MILEQIRSDIKAHLQARDFFAGLDIVLPVKGLITAIIEQQIAEMKLCLLIEIRRGKLLGDDMGTNAADLTAIITIQENVMLNRADETTPPKTADDVLEELFMALSPVSGVSVPCVAKDFEVVSNRGEFLAYEVTCTVQAGWKRVE